MPAKRTRKYSYAYRNKSIAKILGRRKTGKKHKGYNSHHTNKHHCELLRSKNEKIVTMFLQILNTVKLYHWKTNSYSQHKATDELYSNLNEHIDKFVEVLLGKEETRIHMVCKKLDLFDATNKPEYKQRIYEFRDFLISLNDIFSQKQDTDLLNIRDEILGNINQFLYLMTFE